jgi:hypothetical protein
LYTVSRATTFTKRTELEADRKQKYWIEIHRNQIIGKWFWIIKCCNGRVKSYSNFYVKQSLCFNDAYALSNHIGMEIR